LNLFLRQPSLALSVFLNLKHHRRERLAARFALLIAILLVLIRIGLLSIAIEYVRVRLLEAQTPGR